MDSLSSSTLIDYTFKGNSAIPLSSGMLEFQLKHKFIGIDVQGLVKLLLSRFGVVSYSKVHFTLVNVYSPYSNFSFGYREQPIDEVISLNSKLQFTFALRDDSAFEDKVIRKSNFTFIWSSFITVGVTALECSHLGITSFIPNDLRYLYTSVGLVCRSIFKWHTPTEIFKYGRGDTPGLRGSTTSPASLYKEVSLSSIFTQPVRAWKYNIEVWNTCPNLLNVAEFDADFAFYYFAFLVNRVHVNNAVREILGFDCKSSIGKILLSSLIDFIQNLKTPKSSFTTEDLIAPNLLSSIVFTGSSHLQLRVDRFLEDAISEYQMLSMQLDEAFDNTQLIQIISPFEEVVKSILSGDFAFASKLAEKMSYDLHDY